MSSEFSSRIFLFTTLAALFSCNSSDISSSGSQKSAVLRQSSDGTVEASPPAARKGAIRRSAWTFGDIITALRRARRRRKIHPTAAAFSGDRSLSAVGFSNGWLFVSRVSANHTVASIAEPGYSVHKVSFGPHNRYLIAASYGKYNYDEISIHVLASGQLVKRLRKEDESHTDFALSQDGRRLAIASNILKGTVSRGTVAIYSFPGLKALETMPVPFELTGIAFRNNKTIYARSDRGLWVVSSSRKRVQRFAGVSHIDTGTFLRTPGLVPRPGSLISLSRYAPRLYIHKYENNKYSHRMYSDSSPIVSASISSDTARLALLTGRCARHSGYRHQSVKFLAFSTLSLLWRFQLTDCASVIKLGPTGKLLLVGYRSGKVSIYDTTARKLNSTVVVPM